MTAIINSSPLVLPVTTTTSSSSTSSSSVTTSTPPPSVIFLDIDGVLYKGAGSVNLFPKLKELFPTVGPRNYTSYHYDIAATHYFNATAIGHLKSLIRKIPNVIIVLSSNWRKGRTPSQLREIFAKHAFSHLIIDKTPDKLDEEYRKAYDTQGIKGRAREIAYWLEKHPEIKNFVILDDYDSGLSKTFSKQFIHIEKGLLSEKHIRLAATILNSAIFRNEPLTQFSVGASIGFLAYCINALALMIFTARAYFLNISYKCQALLNRLISLITSYIGKLVSQTNFAIAIKVMVPLISIAVLTSCVASYQWPCCIIGPR